MSRKDKYEMFLLLVTIPVMYIAGATSVWRSDLYKSAQLVIEECQKDLPRSQVCELTAKIKEGK